MSSPGSPGAPLPLDAPVVEVTLFEDRARVVRLGRVSLEAGPQRVRVEGVAPVLCDTTLTGSVDSGARVTDCQVRRRIVTMAPGDQEPRDEIEVLEREREALDRRIREIEARLSRLQHRAATLGTLLELSLAEVGEDAAWGRQDASAWARRFDDLRVQAGEAELQHLDESHGLAERREERDLLEVRIESLRHPAREEWAGIDAEIVAEQAGELEVRFEYVVPGACWRPYHTACLTDGPARRVDFRTDACVWQNTGEEWNHVRLLFSTARPSLGTEPPRLTSDVLHWRKKPEEIAVETREQEITTTGLGAETGAADRLPGIDDGGEALSLEADAPSTVRSDGRPCRVPLGRFETEAEVGLVALPELVPAVLMKSTQANPSGRPLLAGPVDLIRGGGFAGRTTLLFVGAGERFDLGWGPEPELRLHRDTEVRHDKQKMMSSWEARQHRATIHLSNIGSDERTVKVTERIPVSEIDKVEIEADAKETTDGIQPDENGFLEWSVVLPAYQRQTLKLKYTLKKHQDVQGV